MPKVKFLPINQECEAMEGESILEVAINHDVPLQHACGGFCACTTCHVIVEDGGENLSEMEEEELEALERAEGRTGKSRLGCQARIKGDVTVYMVNEE